MIAKNLFVAVAVVLFLFTSCASTGGWNTLDIPNDSNYFYATGNAESKLLNVAIDKATLNARTEIARQLEIKLNNLQKSFVEEIGSKDTELNQLYSSTTKAVVSKQLIGSKVKNKKYKEKNGKYHAIVIVEYSVSDANAALVNEIKKNQNLYTRFSAAKSFKELEAEVEKQKQSK